MLPRHCFWWPAISTCAKSLIRGLAQASRNSALSNLPAVQYRSAESSHCHYLGEGRDAGNPICAPARITGREEGTGMAKWRLLILICCASAACCQSEPTGPAAPASFDVISTTDNQIQTLQRRVTAAPRDYAAYDGLGSAFFQKARETGDITYYELAEQTLKKALDLAPQDFRSADPLVHMALVCMGEHRFQDALGYAQKAIGLGSGNLAAFAIEGD